MASLIAQTALSPFISGPLLFLITKAPRSLREPLLRSFQAGKAPASLVTSLKILLTLGLIRQVNRILSEWADNNWIWKSDRARWVWDKEIAVAILDVQPLPEGFEDCKQPEFIDFTS